MTHPNDPTFSVMGITKREYFAVMAMQALLSNSSTVKFFDSESPKPKSIISIAAIAMADAFIAELNKEPNP